MTERTEVVTSEGEYAYPELSVFQGKSKEKIWVRTNSGDIRRARCTFSLYKEKTFSLNTKKSYADSNDNPFEDYG